MISEILTNWWWFFLAVVLWFPAKSLYLWWLRWELWYPQFKWIMLEIVPPKEVLKPFSAMENIFSMLWGIFDGPNWRERWCEGELPLGGGLWFSFEVASFGGEIHFYMRIPDFYRDTAESVIYSQYEEAEIFLVDDYTKRVPQDVPNEDWDMYAEDYTLMKEDYYPIKTYSAFFEKAAEEKRVMEEKRVDPMNSLLEVLSKLQSGEQIWIQIVTNPIVDQVFPWLEKEKRAVEELAKRRSAPSGSKSMFQIAVDFISGKESGGENGSELIAPELRMTPEEKKKLEAIETKAGKPAYQCWIRGVHLYNKNEPHFAGNYKFIRTYLMSQFMTQNLNSLIFYGPTRTRIHYWLRDRRLYLRKRQRFRNYIERLPSLFPRTFKGEPICSCGHIQGRSPGIRATCILNIEELATIFHFPAKIVTPAITPVEAKKAGPPPNLPI